MTWHCAHAFDHRKTFLCICMCMCNVSLAPRMGKVQPLDPRLKQGIVPLCSCHKDYLIVSTRDKVYLFNLFQLLLPFWKSNKRLVVTGIEQDDQIGEGNGNPLQYSCLENPRDGGAWQASIYGIAQSRTRLKQLSRMIKQLAQKHHYTIVDREGALGGFQFSLVTQSCPILFDPMDSACQASLSITDSWSLFKLMSIKSVMPSNHLILCHPLLFLPSIFPSIRVFSNESALHVRWPKY